MEMLQTHPLPQTRIDRLQQLIKKDYADKVNNPQYVDNPEAYQTHVLAILATLPPPKSNK